MRSPEQAGIGANVILLHEDFQQLLDALIARDYQTIGPTMQNGAIIYDEVDTVAEFPVGWTDEQEPGAYRLHRNGEETLFDYAPGPHSWKQWLRPPLQRLWRAKRVNGGFEIIPESEDPPKYAFIGVRACELHAIQIQDQVYSGGAYVDQPYNARREQAFIVAVNCTTAGGTCFCVSMKTGPAVGPG